MFTVSCLALALSAPPPAFHLNLRSRTETAPASGRFHATTAAAAWGPAKTAVVVCDMWDKHWCPGATARVAEMAPRVNALLTAARKAGSLVIHCPSDTMDFYKGTPQRERAMSAPKVVPKVPLQRWCKIDPAKEAPLPIDDSDGGCEEAVKNYRAWTRQHPGIEIHADDAVTDSDEAYFLMRQRGITNVAVLGVHTNMCVLGRPFSIRQLVQQGLNVALVRDLTDAMYNPAKSPFVSHFTGTDLVVEHVEKYWCPTCTSADFLGGAEFRFKADARPHAVIVAAEDEYKTETTLPAFALKHLGREFRVSTVFADAKDPHHLPGLDVLKTADVLILSVRRRPLRDADLAAVRAYVGSGKPVVAVRTSSHAFAPKKGEKPAPGVASWDAFDRDVLGCTYTGHYPNTQKTAVEVPAAATHPVLKDVPAGKREYASWLYKSSPLAADAVVLLTATAGANPAEPLAWVREKRPGFGRVFYCSLGHPDDFADPAFAKLLANAVAWAAGK